MDDTYNMLSFMILFVFCGALLTISNGHCQVSETRDDKIQFDIQGDIHYSRYNFTDIKKPFDGIDAWAEIKGAYWIDKSRSVSPFISIIPVTTSEDEFWWQRNIQASIGLQYYPFDNKYLKGGRLFAIYAVRGYYDKPSEVDSEDEDIQIGVDYYYDNLFDKSIFTTLIWTNARYSSSNFSFDGYDAFLWSGNVKLGPKLRTNQSIVLPYALADWTYVPKHDDRWWENYVRLGAGAKWYPWGNLPYHNNGGIFKDIMRRFNMYAEVVQNAAWLGDSHPSIVEETDFRVGFTFSTSGFLRD